MCYTDAHMSQNLHHFILRLPKELFLELKNSSSKRSCSVNQLIVDLLQEKSRMTGVDSQLCGLEVEELLKEYPQLEALILFGSVARGTATASSDIDLLLVMKEQSKIERSLYRQWAEKIKAPLAISPQFVHFPASTQQPGSLWAEVACDAIVLWEKELRASKTLSKIRRSIAEGNMTQKFAHGQPYWVVKESA